MRQLVICHICPATLAARGLSIVGKEHQYLHAIPLQQIAWEAKAVPIKKKSKTGTSICYVIILNSAKSYPRALKENSNLPF